MAISLSRMIQIFMHIVLFQVHGNVSGTDLFTLEMKLNREIHLLKLEISNLKSQLQVAKTTAESALNFTKTLVHQINLVEKKIDSYSEYCKTLPDDICGPCQCKDDDQISKKYYCDCQNLEAKRDCLEHFQYGIKISGVFKVHQNILKIIQVYCDQETDGGGWTVFQRRQDGSVNFFRNWKDYKAGFGQLQNEFWLGNENIFTQSLQGLYPRGNELRVDLINKNGIHKYAQYERFEVGSETTMYTMHVNIYSGTAGEQLKHHSSMKFSTYDRDNDREKNKNCGFSFNSGWWFNSCFLVNLNGEFHSGGKMVTIGTGIHWGNVGSFNTHYETLMFSEIKIRRRL